MALVPAPRRQPWRIAALTATLVLLSGCAGSGYRYVKNSQVKTYFKVPERWTLFNQGQVLANEASTLTPDQVAAKKATEWVVYFDGNPSPSINHVLDDPPGYPLGLARVRALATKERDDFSLSSLRNEGVTIDQYSAADRVVPPSDSKEVVRSGGLHGTRQVHTIKVDKGLLTVSRTALVDPGTHLVYLLVIGCESRCYQENRRVIDEVVRSWTVKES